MNCHQTLFKSPRFYKALAALSLGNAIAAFELCLEYGRKNIELMYALQKCHFDDDEQEASILESNKLKPWLLGSFIFLIISLLLFKFFDNKSLYYAKQQKEQEQQELEKKLVEQDNQV